MSGTGGISGAGAAATPIGAGGEMPNMRLRIGVNPRRREINFNVNIAVLTMRPAQTPCRLRDQTPALVSFSSHIRPERRASY
jgi:hypothetical protein